ncbi:aminotransferase class I/II-fold pyridoxal phosphate-dependent enzyme [Secundilactobacillus paracollinoides]|uniref:aminotransferase class I/II-fold pyridoxal phosphate-dependent enzyme n=1 Tax=Secundilactobacillus paracollinoides TaxID=240427 RepID=UPI003F45F90B
MEFNASRRLQSVGEKYLAIQQANINQLKKAGIEVLNLGRGNPDLPTFMPVVQAAKTALDNKANHGYPPYGGKPALKTSIKHFYQREYQVALEDDEITVFSGSAVALTALPMALADPEGVVLTPTPAFFGYHIGITMSGAEEWQMPLLEKNNYLPDLENIPQTIRDRSQLMFLNYPHNPTGAGATQDLFDRVVQFGLDNHIAIVHDFAYADISFEHQAPSFLQSKRAKETGIEIYTLSKTFNMAGWRSAFAVGNASIIKLLKAYIQNSVGGTFGVVQDASEYALDTQIKERKQLRDTYLERRNTVIQLLEAHHFSVSQSSGTFFVWLQLPETITDDKQFAKSLLNNAHVAVVPGSAFGEAGQGYLRISLVADKATLSSGINQLITYLKQYRE